MASTPFFSIELKGTQELDAKIDALVDLDLQDILDQSAAICLHSIMFRFLHTMTDSQGQPWIESQAAKNRRASGRDGGTLFDTGKLFRSIQLIAVDSETRAIIANAENDKGVQYGKFAQYGTVKLPKREFLGFSNDDIQSVQNFIQMKINDALRS